MQNKLTNSGPLRESTRKHSIYPLGARGDLAAIREEAGEQAVPRKTVLAWPDFIESKPVAQLNLFERIMQHLFWRHTFGPGGNGKQTEFMRSLLSDGLINAHA
jgi:hypothetical protein